MLGLHSGFLARLAGLAIDALLAASVPAQESPARNFPNKPIRIIVGFVAGSGTDIIARVVSAKMSEGLGQPVIIENKPGAQSIIAAEFVAKSATDGYTALMGPVGPMAMNPGIYARLPHNPVRDFENAARRRLPKSAFGLFAGGAEQSYPVIL